MAPSPNFPFLPRWTRRRSVRFELLEIFRQQGADEGIRACRQFLMSSPEILDEVSLNFIGYFLLAEQHVEGAVAVFELLIETFPYSANAHHSLGEAYCEAGHRDRAAVSYAMFQLLEPRQWSAQDLRTAQDLRSNGPS